MSFVDTILENFAQQPARAAIVELHEAEEVLHDGSALKELSVRARAFLDAQGVKPGDRVALLAGNSARWVAVDLAILAQGAIVVPLYARQDPDELAVMLRNAEPSLLIAGDAELAAKMSEAWPEHCSIVQLDDVVAAEAGVAEPGPVHAFGADDPVSIIYTSGTSGEPKGVMLMAGNVDFMLPRTIARLGDVVVDPGGAPDRIFHFLPFCFAASRILLWTQLMRPNPLHVSTDLSKLVAEMGAAKPNFFLTVPAVLERIRLGVGDKIAERGGIVATVFTKAVRAFGARARGEGTGLLGSLALSLAESAVFPKVKQQIGPNLDSAITGSAPLSEETQRWFEMLGIPIYQAYGLTETTGIVSLDLKGRVVPGRVGHVIEGVETRISEEGELQVRGPNLFAGYYRKADETESAMTEGWFRTGDQVDIEDDNLKIVGRIKNLIIPESGHNIAPEPIEEKFMEHCPQAEQCMLVGHGKPYLSIIYTGGAQESAVQSAIEHINASVPHYRKIRKSWRTPEAFTPENGLLTANQKLKRRTIEQHFAQQIEGLYQ